MAAWGFFVRGSAQDVIGQIERLRGALPDAGRGKCRSHGRIYAEISFHGTQLLSPSACSTAKEDAAKDGLEMDSRGMIAQQNDAEAVTATLWDVNDASTSRLMGDFYARWVKDPADGKAEALRQTQIALLKGPAASTAPGSGRGFESKQ
jgi:hypothetical protein